MIFVSVFITDGAPLTALLVVSVTNVHLLILSLFAISLVKTSIAYNGQGFLPKIIDSSGKNFGYANPPLMAFLHWLTLTTIPTPFSMGLYDIKLRYSHWIQITILIDIHCYLLEVEVRVGQCDKAITMSNYFCIFSSL